MGFNTRAVHAGEAPDPFSGAVGVPIYQNSTFAFNSSAQIDAVMSGERPHYVYSRDANPTVRSLELKLAELEGAESVVMAASGMAAISTTMLHLIACGGHVVVSDSTYAYTKTFFRKSTADFGGTVTIVDTRDLENLRGAINANTRAVFVESFSNPLLKVSDITAIAKVAAEMNVLLVVDNTFVTPALLRPLELGADIVVHSATKYLSGHGNLLGGVVAGSTTVIAGIRQRTTELGGVMSPHTASQLLVGVKTLGLRMRQHCLNAMAIAELMECHPAIEKVNYPGLETHPEYETAKRLTGDRFGGMMSFRLANHDETRATFLDALTIPVKAVSLGDVGSLVFPYAEEGVIRLSVGIEDTEDLLRDIRQALDAAASESQSNTP
jgi:methionine-gamma-lyase